MKQLSPELQQAILSGNTQETEKFLKTEPDVENIYRTAIKLALDNDKVEIVELLMQNNPSFGIGDPVIEDALHKLIENGKVKTIESILNKLQDIPKVNELSLHDIYSQLILFWAAKKNQIEIVKSLMQHQSADNLAKAAYFALGNNHIKITELLINQGANINSKQYNDKTLLHLALERSNIEIAKLLIEKGADIDAKDRDRNMPIHLAIKINNKEIVELLLSKDVEANNIRMGKKGLYSAVKQGNKEIVELLLAKYGDNTEFKNELPEAIFQAIEQNRTEIVKLLLKNGADANINAQDTIGIHEAIKNGHTEIVKLLIEHGADVNIADKRGKTPAHFFETISYNEELAELLIKNGTKLPKNLINNLNKRGDEEKKRAKSLQKLEADFQKAYKNHSSAVHERLFSSVDEDNTDKIKRILAAYPEIKYHAQETSDGEKLTPIQYAIKHDKMDSLTAILESGYDKKYRKQLTEPLHMAVEKNNVKVVEKLIDSGADPMSWHKGKRSFHILDKKGEEYLPMLALFVKKGILNPYKDKLPTVAGANKEMLENLTFAQDNKCGNTPLHIALHNSKDLKEVLADNLDNINSKNANGKTPLDLAKTQEERLLLVENGADPKYIASKLSKEEKQELNKRYKDYQTLMVNTKKYLTHTFKTYPDSMQFSHRIQEVMFNDKNRTFQNLSIDIDKDKTKIDELAKKLFKDMKTKKSDLQQESIFKRFIDGLKKIFGLDKFNSHMSEISEEFKKGLEKMNEEKISLPSK